LEELRKESNIPVFILTSKSLIEDKVKWLELGADDYITKPFDITEFLARIKAILRRYNKLNTNIIKIWDLEIYPDQEKVIKNWAEIWLSSLEFRLLMYFIRNRWKILDRKDIYENVWGDFDSHMFSRTVDVYVGYLRKKLWKDLIKTKRWSWYYLDII
jgi:DNA-binding response OmpR family regulator